MSNAVELDHVTKSFGPQVAVDDLSLTVPTGSIYGFIGPNGSGKTTTLRIIMRIFLPDRGTVRVLGEESLKAASDRVTYLPEERGLYKRMKVREVLKFYAELKGMRDCRQPIADWLERMQLADAAEKKVEALSKGMSQKVQFIASVISNPELVLLDEPFSGLDPVNENLFREAILELRRKGTTIIFSTHNMAVAEQMCDSIFMIYKGQKVLDGPLDAIQDSYGFDTIRVQLAGGSLHGLPGVAQVTDIGRYQELRLDPGADSQAVLRELMARGRVDRFERTRPSLHDIFVRIAKPKEEESEPGA
ncbi:MAG TPA: ATP-binding cassette domain-containing protein [Gemmataceae bacterium]|jgi:ABC-2 type transport system ATP-binding protein|nr:ATP-binding cassette domain-containing protein [Gemmataceae bacterium]